MKPAQPDSLRKLAVPVGEVASRDEAFWRCADAIMRAAGPQGEEPEHPVPNRRLDSPCLATSGQFAE